MTTPGYNSLDMVLDDPMFTVGPPLDQNIYRYVLGLLPAAYYFTQDILYFVQLILLGPQLQGKNVQEGISTDFGIIEFLKTVFVTKRPKSDDLIQFEDHMLPELKERFSVKKAKRVM